MDYYYALLDSYQLLKQRKLRITINEELDDAGVLKYLTTQAAGGTSDAPNTVLGNIRLFTPKDDPQSVTGGLGQAAARLVVNNQLQPYETLNDTGKKIIDRIRSGEEEGGGNTTTEDPILRQALDQAAKVWKSFTGDDGFQESLFPGLTSTRGRVAKSVINILSKGSKVLGFGGDKPDQVVQQMINTPCEGEPDEVVECNANKLEAARVLASLGEVFKNYTDSGKVLDEATVGKLKNLTPKLTITKSGVKFGEVFIFFKSKSSSKTDVLRNTVDQLNKAIDEYNKDWEGSPDNKIPRIGSQSSGGGINRANRGTAAEVIIGMSIAMTNLRRGLDAASSPADRRKAVAKARAEVLELYQQAKKDGTAEDLRDMFSIGSDIMLGNILAMNDDDAADADYVEAITNFLLNKGFSPKDVADLIEGAGSQVGRALVLLAYANRDFDFDLFGESPPTKIQQMGQTGSNDLGAKADIHANYDDQKCKDVTKYYDSLLSNKQKEHYALGCGDSDGVGIDSLARKNPEGEGCQVSVEVKTLDNLRSNKGFGQSGNNRANNILKCDSDKVNVEGENASSREFLDLHDSRMSECGVSTKNACSFSKELESSVEDITALLDPSKAEYPNGGAISLKQRQDLLQQWAMNKGGVGKLNEKDKARYQAALRYVRGESEDRKIEDKKEAMAIGDQLWQTKLGSTMDEGKAITGDAQDYILSRMHLGGGSTEETGKVGRALEEGIQAFGLNNAEIMGCIGGIKKGAYQLIRSGNTYKVVDKEGKTRMQVSAERGNFEIAGSKETGNDIQKQNPTEEGLSTDSNDMLLEFLKGQQVLLTSLLK